MSVLFPFRALRPAPDAAARVASVPYDVVSTDEARALAADNSLSFLHVTRSEIDLPAGTSPYDPAVYAQAVRNFEGLTRQAPMIIEPEPSLYLYRLRMGSHEQVGVAGGFSVDEYDRGLIKKHEKTRKDKEDDRTRHITELRAQTGVVFLTYRASRTVDAIARRACERAPLYEFTAAQGVSHAVWRATPEETTALVDAFGALSALYIADGHHRAASASRARAAMAGAGGRTTDAERFIAVAFPDAQVKILAYNRAVKDLAGASPAEFLARLGATVAVTEGGPAVRRAGQVAMFLAGRWHTLTLAPPAPGTPRADALDVEQLQRQVLGPLLRIGDPRTDKRIDFVGGIRGPAELERLVASGQAAVAFALYPVSIQDLMTVSDEGGIMPPKSTWFEPKLLDGLLVHLI